MRHPAIEKLAQIIPTGSNALTQALDEFSNPKDWTIENFKTGVKCFVALANIEPHERHSFFGDIHAGLYNNNQLATLWNLDCADEESVFPHDLDGIVNAYWRVIETEGSIAFRYDGATPSTALNLLLTGPSVIDCGMFCQLGIWFGLRYVLGDEAFDAQFGHTPFWITRANFEEAQEHRETQGNPLYTYFEDIVENTVSIEHIFNDPNYILKHPGGNYPGENCLVIDGQYYAFSPFSPKNGVARERITQDLLDSFNEDPDELDKAAIHTFTENPDFFQSRYGSVYELPFSAEHSYKLLLCNPDLLQEFADALDTSPACQVCMHEFYTNKEFFVDSFFNLADDDDETYTTFFELSEIKEAFQSFLEFQDPGVFQVYYRGILSGFEKYVQSISGFSCTLEEYEQEKQSRTINSPPSFIHFDFYRFIATLRIGSGCSPIFESPSSKRKKIAGINALVLSPYRYFTATSESAQSSPRQAATPVEDAGEEASEGVNSYRRCVLGSSSDSE